MKEFKQYGAYGLILNNNRILLIKKNGGPYNGKLDLPGGTIEFCETPENAMKRELEEEVGIKVNSFNLFDANSVAFEWKVKDGLLLKVHHTGIFYKVLEYEGEIKGKVNLSKDNNDSLGAEFYDISKLKKNDLSRIAILELEKLGYKVN